MKKSEFKKAIKEEIIDILEAVSADDIKAQQELNKELEKTAQLKKDAGIEEGNDSDKFQDDGYVNHTYDDSVIDKYNVPVEPTAVFEKDEFKSDDKYWADYQDIGIFYLDGFNKKHSLTDDELEILGKKIVDRLYKGDIGKAYDAIVNRDKLDIPGKPAFVKEEDDEPKAKDLKGEPLSKIGYKLADTQKEMKQVVKKWSATEEGPAKDKLKDRLRVLNKIKKELESLLENKK
tara:strand:+ start:29 stop:727 length:699 start_codon:yes stop_codon:yes gene_type:complete